MRAAAGRPDWEEHERRSRMTSWARAQRDPDVLMQRSWDPLVAEQALESQTATPVPLRAPCAHGTADFTFNMSDRNCSGELERYEFTNAVRLMLHAGGMSELDDQLDAFMLDREFAEADTSRSGTLTHEEFAIWYNRFHDWIEERKLLRDLEIDLSSTGISLFKTNDETILAVLRHCAHFTSLAISYSSVSNRLIALIASKVQGRLLKLSLNHSTGFDADGVRELLSHCPDLKLLDLSGCTQVSKADLRPFVPSKCDLVL